MIKRSKTLNASQAPPGFPPDIGSDSGLPECCSARARKSKRKATPEYFDSRASQAVDGFVIETENLRTQKDELNATVTALVYVIAALSRTIDCLNGKIRALRGRKP